MKETIKNFFQGNYQTFYSKYLPDVKKIGSDEFKTRCPFPNHEDKNPSFCFNNQTGRYYCHGCGKKGDIFHFYGKINNLNTKSNFGKILRGIVNDFNIYYEEQKLLKRANDTWPSMDYCTQVYDYQDEKKQYLFSVLKFEPPGEDKTFRQARRNGKDWIKNIEGVRRVLYHLPEIIKTQELLIVEGEKDADALIELGLTTTTSPMGAKKWRPEYNEYLKGKDIVLIPDNDLEGKEHMAQVAQSLNGTSKSLKWIELPDLPSKGDVSDFIAKFDDKAEAAEKLSVMIEGAGPYEPPKKATIEDVILQAKDFTALELPDKKKFLEPWLTEAIIALITAWRGVGKTWLAMAILNSVSKGIPFGPWKAGESVPCLFLDGEMASQDILERARELNVDPSLYIYSDAYSNSLGLPRANLSTEKWRSDMKRILITKGIKLWVLDNIGSLTPGIDENSKKDWDPINAWLLELRFAGIATIMLHHEGKGGGQRGTSAREDNLDISINLRRPFDYNPEDGCKFVMHFEKNRVRTQDLPLLADTQFQLSQDESGQLVWTYDNAKEGNKKEVLRSLNEGIAQKEIPDLLGLSKGYVSKLKAKLIEEKYIGKNGKITLTGLSYLHEQETGNY